MAMQQDERRTQEGHAEPGRRAAHTNKAGEPKLLRECRLPLTGLRCVHRIITDLATLDVVEGGLKIVELADGVTEEEVRAKTEATIVGGS